MNEKIFKTLGQIGASGIVVGIITVIVAVSYTHLTLPTIA